VCSTNELSLPENPRASAWVIKGMPTGFSDSGVPWFRGGLVFKAHRLLYHPNSRRENNKEEKKTRVEARPGGGFGSME